MAINESTRDEIAALVKSKVLTSSLIIFGILGLIVGLGLWQINTYAEAKMESMIRAQFEEASIKKATQAAAAEQAAKILAEQVQPAVELFRTNTSHRYTEITEMTDKTKLREQEGLGARDRIVGVQTDLVKIQKYVAKIQYLIAKGKDQNPNPYQAEITQALNDLMDIAIPDKAERAEFIKDLDKPNP